MVPPMIFLHPGTTESQLSRLAPSVFTPIPIWCIYEDSTGTFLMKQRRQKNVGKLFLSGGWKWIGIVGVGLI